MPRLLPLCLAAVVLLPLGMSCAEEAAAQPAPDEECLVLRNCQIRVVDRAQIAAARDGVIRSIEVRVGQVVSADEILVQLDDELVRKKLEFQRAKAANDVNVRYSRVAAATARAEYDSALELSQQDAMPVQQLRRTKLEYERSLLAIEQSEVELQLAGLEADQLEVELDKMKIRSPFQGVVNDVKKRRGEAVQMGEPVLEIVNTDRVQITGFGKVEDVWNIKPGVPVRAQLNAPHLEKFGVLDETFEGELISVDVNVEPSTQEVRVIAEVINRNGILREGMQADLSIYHGRDALAAGIPTAKLKPETKTPQFNRALR